MTMARSCCSLRKLFTLSRGNARSLSTLPPDTVFFPDQDMIVCWHPEKPFPYECSKPLPPPERPSNAILKIGAKEVRATFARGPQTEAHKREIAVELGKMTYTCMHRWFPRSRDKKAKKTAMDRPYL